MTLKLQIPSKDPELLISWTAENTQRIHHFPTTETNQQRI